MRKSLDVVAFLLMGSFITSCKQHVKVHDDEVYSRHLQRHVKLTIVSTPPPKDLSELNLLLLNDGQDFGQFHVAEIVDSLWQHKLIQPLVVVGIHAGDRMKEYGIAGFPDYKNNGEKASYYTSFISDELYPFAKKKCGVRKFNSVAIAGCSLGGLSAFDIAWEESDKIDLVGVFSGSFWLRDKDAADPTYSDETNRIMLQKIKSSRKKPHLKYWFYAGDKEETADRDNDGIIDVVDDTKDLVTILRNKQNVNENGIMYTEDIAGMHDYLSWRKHLAEFLIWAFPVK